MQDKKISIFIDKQLSRYVRTNFQKYVTFIKAYYEFLESNYGPYQVTQTLEHSRDITAKYTSGVIKLKLKFPSAEDESYFYNNYADSKDEIVQSNVNGVVIAKGYVVSYEKTDTVTANLNIVVTSGLFTQAVGNQLNFTDATVTQILHVNSGSLLTENPNLNKLIDELSPDYPQTLIASKQLTIKGLADFLKAKGTEDSFRYFFRSVYNSDLEFYYPKKYMLRVSDGKWNLYSYITIKRNSTVSYLNKRIVGNTSGAVAAISRVKTVEYNIGGTQTQFYELYVEDLSEDFLYNETISYYDNLDLVTTTDVVVSVAGSPSLLRKGVLNSGSSIYTIGDEITIDNTYVDIPSGKTLTELLVRITDLDTEGKLKGFDFVDHGILNYIPSITGVNIIGTSGQFTCNNTTLAVNNIVTITGTFGGTGSITDYTSGTVYKVSSVTGSSPNVTGFTLTTVDGTAIVTTVGTPTGLTYTVIISPTSTGTFKAYIPPSVSFGSAGAVQEIVINDGGLYPAGSTITATISAPPAGGTNPVIQSISTSLDSGTLITGVAISGTAGQFTCSNTILAVNDIVTITGTFGGTGSITGYTSGTLYKVSAITGTSPNVTGFTLTTESGTAIVTTAGTPTGLTYLLSKKKVITGITLSSYGTGYKKTPTITFSSTIAAEREASATVFLNLAQIQFTPKTLANEPGQFVNTDGFVSWNKYIQNDYYQDFSYVLKSEEDYSDYKNTVKDLLNPAGMVFFGIISLFNSFSLNKYGSPQEYPEFFYPLKVLSFDVKSFLLKRYVNVTTLSCIAYPCSFKIFHAVAPTNSANVFILESSYKLALI